jgi:hypothetical protein
MALLVTGSAGVHPACRRSWNKITPADIRAAKQAEWNHDRLNPDDERMGAVTAA